MVSCTPESLCRESPRLSICLVVGRFRSIYLQSDTPALPRMSYPDINRYESRWKLIQMAWFIFRGESRGSVLALEKKGFSEGRSLTKKRSFCRGAYFHVYFFGKRCRRKKKKGIHMLVYCKHGFFRLCGKNVIWICISRLLFFHDAGSRRNVTQSKLLQIFLGFPSGKEKENLICTVWLPFSKRKKNRRRTHSHLTKISFVKKDRERLTAERQARQAGRLGLKKFPRKATEA